MFLFYKAVFYKLLQGLIYLSFYVTFNSQGHIATGSLRVEERVHTSWSRFCTVNHWASASNYQLSNMKCPAQDSNRRPQRLEASTLTATPPSPPPPPPPPPPPYMGCHNSVHVTIPCINIEQKIYRDTYAFI